MSLGSTGHLPACSARVDLAGQADASGTGTFLAPAFGEFNLLAFAELVKAGAFDFRRVEEQVAAVPFDESKTLTADNLLNHTLWHFCTPLK
jgi:hypothetical protein